MCTGVAELQHHQQGGKVWRLTLLCFIATMLIAMVLAVAASHISPAGAGMNLAMFGDAMAASTAKPKEVNDFVQQIVGGLFMNPLPPSPMVMCSLF